jgi:hypothetical protein
MGRHNTGLCAACRCAWPRERVVLASQPGGTVSRLRSWIGQVISGPGTAGPTLPTVLDDDTYVRELTALLERVLAGDLATDWVSVERQVVSTLGVLERLCKQHRVDEQGWCLICWEATREWWRPWRRRRACTVRAAVSSHMPHAATADLRRV